MVVMNPPFSNADYYTGIKAVAIKGMRPAGRLVAITGRSIVMNAPMPRR